MPETNEELALLKREVEVTKNVAEAAKIQLMELKVEFRYFRNIMITLYLTIVAPLVVAIFMSILGKGIR